MHFLPPPGAFLRVRMNRTGNPSYPLVTGEVRNLFRRWRQLLTKSDKDGLCLISDQGRIVLQPFKASEIPLVEEWFQDQDTCQLAFGVKAPWEVLNTIRTEYIEELQKDKVGVLSVRLKTLESKSAPVGFVRYHISRRGGRRLARVGIILGKSDARGKGIGREAFSTLLSYLFSERNIQTIELDTAIFNQAARNCFEACGFKAIREMEFTSMHGSWTERRLVMRLEKPDWLTLQTKNSD